MTGTITRIFLGWDQPLLLTAVNWLADKGRVVGEWNLKEVIVVVPGRRAGRRLLERLVLQAEDDKVWLTPPRIITLGELPELLYPLKRPLANDLVQQLTWAKALREVGSSVLSRIASHPPTDEDPLAWWSFGMLLWNQHRELAAEGFDFADVVARGRDVPGFTESARWESMRQVQEAYLRSLDALDLWDVQTARLVALRQKEPATNCDIVLLGTVDMNQATRGMLDLIADRVTSLVGAPSELADRFDSHGCLIPDAWSSVATEIPEDRIRVCDGPADQAKQVARELAAFDGRYRADEIVVGLADESLAPFIERELTSLGVETRWIEGHDVTRAGPVVLLAVVAEFLERNRFDDFAALVRHPDVSAWWKRQQADAAEGSPIEAVDLTALDELFRQHLPISPDALRSLLEHSQVDADSMLTPRKRTRRRRAKSSRLNERLLFPESSDSVEAALHAGQVHSTSSDLVDEGVQRFLVALSELLAPLRTANRQLSDWGEPLLAWLRAIYGDEAVDESTAEGRMITTALQRLRDVSVELTSIPRSIAPKVCAADAIRCAVKRAAGEFVPPDPSPDAIEMLGWLELPLDDTLAAIVTSVNEDFVPTSLNSDLFLPNELRRRLGLYDNARRYARDAYAVAVLQHARKDLVWLVARRDKQGNPLFPSRLLLAVNPSELPARVLRFLEHEEPRPNDTDSTNTEPPLDDRQQFATPRPEQLVALIQRPELLRPVRELQLKATDFKSYLACPYRYFLRDVLGLRPLNDRAVEMDAPAFGSVLHEVLRRFGKSAASDSTDHGLLLRELLRFLNSVVLEQFGSRRRAAVNVQIAQIEGRLEAFASWQARWRKEGWRIEHVEKSFEPDATLPPHLKTKDIALRLHGRIDRIDRHDHSGEVAILDYKSGDQGDVPQQTHRKSGAWIDLQLPMYRHLAKTLSPTAEPRLGYINLPRDLNAVGERFAEWTADELADADEAALTVAQQIANRVYWPPENQSRNPFDEFSAICQVGVFGTSSPIVPTE